jgi:serine/threonine protein kinase
MTEPDEPSTDAGTESQSPQEQALNAVLGPFLDAERSGRRGDRQALIAAHPGLADELRAFFADYDRLQAIAGPLRGTAANPPSIEPRTGRTTVGSHGAGAAVETALADTQAIDRRAPTAPDPSPGSVITYFGDYVLLRELGRGGMGVVYEARQVSLNRLVALKMLRAGAVAGDDELRRFQTEAEAVAALDHPGIVPVYEVGEYEGRRYFTMKLVPGQSLAARRDARTGGFRDAARLVAAVATAVDHAHQRGILHRDLKPANILIDEQGRPLVTDFGLAKRVEADIGLTQSGEILGTPAYMAPEQALGRRASVTTAADVHGLGAILYYLLTGRPPFAADSVIETIEQVRTQPPESPSRRRPDVPRDLEVICLKCLEKDPARRYTSAAALAADLNRWLTGEPIAARAVSAPTRAWMWCRRRPAIAALLAALVVSTIIGSAGIVWNWREALRQRDEAERSAATTRTINDFLSNDVLSQADPEKNARGGRKVTVEEVLDRAAATVGVTFADRPLIEAALRETIGKAYRSLTAFDKAEPHLKASYEIRLRQLGPHHRETLNALDSLASLYWDQSRFGEAEPMFRKALDDRRGAFGSDDRDTIASLNNLALLYTSLGRFAEAIPLLREAYDRGRRVFGPTERDTLTSLSNLGTAVRRVGRPDEAEPLIRESLESTERRYGPRNPATLSVLDNYASVLQELGRLDESEAAFRRVVAARLDVLGPDHLHTYISKGNLALLLQQRSKLAESQRLFEECLEGTRRLVGDRHHDTISHMINLASVLRARGLIVEAEATAREALSRSRRRLGDANPITLLAMNNEATLLQDLGRFDEAEPLFRAAYDGRRQVLGDSDTLTLTTAVNLAVLLLAKRDNESAAILLRDLLPVVRRSVRPKDPLLSGFVQTLGRAELRSGRPAEAEPLLRESFDIDSNPVAANLLGECLTGLRRYSEAESLLLASTPPLLAALTSRPAKAAEIAAKLDTLYTAWSRPEQAEEWHLRVLDLRFPADQFASPPAVQSPGRP